MSHELGPVRQSRPWFIDLLSSGAFLITGLALVKVLRGFPMAAAFAGIIALGLSWYTSRSAFLTLFGLRGRRKP
jgi:hypothetical protein